MIDTRVMYNKCKRFHIELYVPYLQATPQFLAGTEVMEGNCIMEGTCNYSDNQQTKTMQIQSNIKLVSPLPHTDSSDFQRD